MCEINLKTAIVGSVLAQSLIVADSDKRFEGVV